MLKAAWDDARTRHGRFASAGIVFRDGFRAAWASVHPVVPRVLSEALDILVTGVAVWVIVRWWGTPVAYGGALWLAVYYYRLLWSIPREELFGPVWGGRRK